MNAIRTVTHGERLYVVHPRGIFHPRGWRAGVWVEETRLGWVAKAQDSCFLGCYPTPEAAEIDMVALFGPND